MKKGLIVMMMVLAAGLHADAAAQKHRHSPTVVATTDTAQQRGTAQNGEELVAYSDTTNAQQGADSVLASDSYGGRTVVSLGDLSDGLDHLDESLGHVDVEALGGMLMVAAIVFFIFVLGPVLILLLVFYFLNKRRKDRLRMAEMAMQNGQPIPHELLDDTATATGGASSNDALWQKGMRQTFLGIGLMFFLGYALGNLGVGIGMLVACIGVGKLVIVKTARKKIED